MPTLEANGQTLYYEVHGEGEPLLCVMGLSADTLAWTLQMAAFSAKHQTVIFDNRDVGQASLADGPYEIADMAQDALALADALELDSFHLLGVSMGGAISQEIALAAPERVRTLTLAVTFAAGGPWARKLSEVWAARVRRATREERVDELMLLTFSEEFFENEQQAQWVRGMMLQNPHPQDAEAFIRQLEACGRHDARAGLRSVQLPTHVIGAERDILVPVWKSQELAELIPGAQLTVMPGAAHGVNVEGAERFNGAVLDFIAERAPAPA
ncbi:MAG: 3-oxoadipate enol-lactonase [Thermoleophilaceae bacterium]|jgi:pimeloyl-ACP methyl ester carboxylesterase|nr:3-oxoadipate enol-lactonase [Thermoleophilaceae bacterium]